MVRAMRTRQVVATLVTCIGLCGLLATSTGAAAPVRVDDPNVPFYGRVLNGEEWSAVIFYRPPSCVPPGFTIAELLSIDPLVASASFCSEVLHLRPPDPAFQHYSVVASGALEDGRDIFLRILRTPGERHFEVRFGA